MPSAQSVQAVDIDVLKNMLDERKPKLMDNPEIEVFMKTCAANEGYESLFEWLTALLKGHTIKMLKSENSIRCDTPEIRSDVLDGTLDPFKVLRRVVSSQVLDEFLKPVLFQLEDRGTVLAIAYNAESGEVPSISKLISNINGEKQTKLFISTLHNSPHEICIGQHTLRGDTCAALFIPAFQKAAPDSKSGFFSWLEDKNFTKMYEKHHCLPKWEIGNLYAQMRKEASCPFCPTEATMRHFLKNLASIPQARRDLVEVIEKSWQLWRETNCQETHCQEARKRLKK